MRKLFIIFHDKDGNELSGSGNYCLHLPVNMFVVNLWCVTVGDHDSGYLSGNVEQMAKPSLHDSLIRNYDNSLDLFFGPETIKEKPANWIQTTADTRWYVYVCFYWPANTFLNNTWNIGSIEKMIYETA